VKKKVKQVCERGQKKGVVQCLKFVRHRIEMYTSTAVFSRKRRQRTKNFLIGWLMFPLKCCVQVEGRRCYCMRIQDFLFMLNNTGLASSRFFRGPELNVNVNLRFT
jgi:hypothetical protein